MYKKLNNFVINELNLNPSDVNIICKLNSLNNSCYKITYLNKPYFIKIIDNKNSSLTYEKDIVNLSSINNLGPKLLYFSNVTNIMVCDWIDGISPSESMFSSEFFINKLVAKLKILHNLKSINSFNPFDEIKSNINLCKSLNLKLPSFINNLLIKLEEIKSYYEKNIDFGLCHNDLNPSNFIISKSNLYIIDYEFSSMGDIFFDLATLAWMMSTEGRKTLLNIYFNSVTTYHYKKLNNYLFVVKFWNATWSLIKSQKPHNDYDYKKGSEIIFKELYFEYIKK